MITSCKFRVLLTRFLIPRFVSGRLLVQQLSSQPKFRAFPLLSSQPIGYCCSLRRKTGYSTSESRKGVLPELGKSARIPRVNLGDRAHIHPHLASIPASRSSISPPVKMWDGRSPAKFYTPQRASCLFVE